MHETSWRGHPPWRCLWCRVLPGQCPSLTDAYPWLERGKDRDLGGGGKVFGMGRRLTKVGCWLMVTLRYVISLQRRIQDFGWGEQSFDPRGPEPKICTK